jgi:dihydroflavonol-4-reductase
VTDRDSVRRGMRGADQVLHLAGLYAFWVPDARAFRAVNVDGTRHVMECALEAGVSKVVHVSTVAVYGTPAARPFREDSPVGPARFSAYARTKYEGDLIAWRLHAERGLPLVVLYPATVWGAGDKKASGQYVRDIVERRFPCRGLENRVLTLVHVDDVVETIVRAAATPGTVGERYLIGRGSRSARSTARSASSRECGCHASASPTRSCRSSAARTRRSRA